MKTKRRVRGEYNRNGYEIYAGATRLICRYGNCKYDSAQWLPIGSAGTIGLDAIRELCESTGKEIAQERGAQWDGAKQIDDSEEEG